MKLLRGEPTGAMMEALAACVAHRCVAHQEIPPLNDNEGNGSSECGACCGEELGTRLAEKALELYRNDVLCSVLDGYADRLEHHAKCLAALEIARNQLVLAGLRAEFIDVLIGGE